MPAPSRIATALGSVPDELEHAGVCVVDGLRERGLDDPVVLDRVPDVEGAAGSAGAEDVGFVARGAGEHDLSGTVHGSVLEHEAALGGGDGFVDAGLRGFGCARVGREGAKVER
jgi:hypothetical protein